MSGPKFGNNNPLLPDTANCQNGRFWVDQPMLQRTGYEHCPQQELTKLREDRCYLRRRNYDAMKPYKFITYHHHPYGADITPPCYVGQYFWDGYGEAQCAVNPSNDLRISGTLNTNPRIIQTLDNLRPNWPHIRGYHDADIESPLYQAESTQAGKKNCKPVEQNFPDQGLIWEYFDHLYYNPQELKHVVNPHWMRAGISTRNDLRQHWLARPTCVGKVAMRSHPSAAQ